MTLGVIIGYLVGTQIIKMPRLRNLLSPKDVGTVNKWLEHYGWPTFSLTRSIPVLAEVSVMLAGASRISFGKVVLFTTPANLAIAVVYSLLFVEL